MPWLDFDAYEKEIVFSRASGLPVGTMYYRNRKNRALLEDERQWCRAFLVQLKKDKEARTTMKSVDNKWEYINRVVLCGVLEQVTHENGFFALLRTSEEEGAKWVPLTAHEKEPRMKEGLLVDLAKFDKGDVIYLKGYCRAWSQKVDGKWMNKLEVRITEVKPECVPQRKQAQRKQAEMEDSW